MSVPLWKSSLLDSLVSSNQHSRSFVGIVTEYQKLLDTITKQNTTVAELQKQNADLRDKNAVLTNDVNKLKESGSEETKKRLEELETKLHAQQEDLTAAYKTKLKNAEEMLRLNQVVQQIEGANKILQKENDDCKSNLQLKVRKIEELEKAVNLKVESMEMLKREYDAEKKEKTTFATKLEALEVEHAQLVNRWMQKVREDAEKMNKQLEEESKIMKQKTSQKLQEDAKKNFGAVLNVGRYDVSLVPERAQIRLESHSLEGNDLSFSPSGQYLATCSSDKEIKLWDSRGTFQQAFLGHSQPVMTINYSPNEELLLSGSVDKTLCIWKVQLGKVIQTLAGHQDKVYSAVFCPDSVRVVSGSCDRTVKCWDLVKGYCTRTILCVSSCNSVAVDKTGLMVASAHFDKSVRLWDYRDGKELKRMEDLHTQQITYAEFASNGNWLMTSGKDGIIKISDIRTYETVIQLAHQELQIPANYSKPCLSPDSNHAAVGGADGNVYIFDILGGKLEKILKGSHKTSVIACAWNNMSSTVASIDKSGVTVVWGP